MSLKDVIHGAVSPLVEKLSTELGEDVEVRRIDATQSNADGSPKRLEVKVPGINAPIPMILTPITKTRAQRDWGMDLDITMEATLSDTWNLEDGWVLRPVSGPYVGYVFELVDNRPEPMGGVLTLALRRIA